MSTPILFRSLRHHHHRSSNSLWMIRHRGDSWSHLRSHIDSDDIRDIVWHKFWPWWLKVREREDRWDFDIVWCTNTSIYDHFSTPWYPISKNMLHNNIQLEIRASAIAWWYNYHHYNNTQELQKSHPKNALIMLSGNISTKTLFQLSHFNDVVYIDAIHPYEYSPDKSILFLGKILKKKYIVAYKNYMKERGCSIKKARASYVAIHTHESISKKLNYFFKNRFKYL